FATFADVDNDGWLDLFAIGGDGRGYLFRNAGNGTFTDVTARAGVADVHGAKRGIFVDLDHDGDLDLLLVGPSGRTVYRNNIDGTFTESSAAYGIAASTPSSDAAAADYDNDGNADLFLSGADPSLWRNRGDATFTRDVRSDAVLRALRGLGIS